VKRDGGDVVLGLAGQQGMEFDECSVGMIGDELSDFLLVGFEFGADSVTIFFGSDGAGFAALLSKSIDPGGTDAVFFCGVFAGHTVIAIFQNSFS
jgi:hypothetical protein